MICHQRLKRDAERDLEALLYGERSQDTGPIGYTIEAIGKGEADEFIQRYEHLSTVGHPLARYGARNAAGELAAVALFGRPHVQAAGICRALDPRNLSEADREYLGKVICLERGACAHWAHRHCASWFLPRVLARASADHGWKIFFAYSDQEAGEIGTVYQAANWLYIGQGPGRRTGRTRPKFRHPAVKAGRWLTDRSFHRRGLSMAADVGRIDGLGIRSNRRPWEARLHGAKGKYVCFVGTRAERRALLRALRYPVLPYPKRADQRPPDPWD